MHKISMSCDSFGEHEDTYNTWHRWIKEKKFDGLTIPKSFTSSMVAAIKAIDSHNIELLSFALNSARTFTTKNSTGDEKINFVAQYANKVNFPIAIVK